MRRIDIGIEEKDRKMIADGLSYPLMFAYSCLSFSAAWADCPAGKILSANDPKVCVDFKRKWESTYIDTQLAISRSPHWREGRQAGFKSAQTSMQCEANQRADE